MNRTQDLDGAASMQRMCHDDGARRDGVNGRTPCTRAACGEGSFCRYSHEDKAYYKVVPILSCLVLLLFFVSVFAGTCRV